MLRPAGVHPVARRTAELRPFWVIVQLVGGRGIAVLPSWAVAKYLDAGMVVGKRVGRAGLRGYCCAARRTEDAGQAFLEAFVELARDHSFRALNGIRPVV